jgi:carboxyl-terminal processing protease
MHTDMVWNGPLAVLVNRNSASASEIFAGAIQDYGRGVIIGENTYGKGTVQNLVDLDQMSQHEKPTFGELKMTIQQFFRVDGESTQLRGVTPDISFPLTVDFDQNGEQTYDNALAWTSIPAANYTPTSDLKTIVPLLEARHDARATKTTEWQALEADIADWRKVRKETTISLNEQKRRAERDEQERKRLERHPKIVQAEKAKDVHKLTSQHVAHDSFAEANALRKIGSQPEDATDNPVSEPKDEPRTDDGLQADERGLTTDVAEEKARKAEKDVVLNEAAHIVADIVDIVHADTKLAAQVLPHTSIEKPVN